MRILLIGSEGQLARDLARVLSVHELTLRSHRELEVRDDVAVDQTIAESHPDCVINTAAYHRVDECEDRPELALAVNAAGAYNLARSSARHSAILVHFSTDYVFGGTKTSPYTEADLPNPLSVYGMSKWSGERLIERYCPHHYIIRTCGLYGAGSASKGGNFVRSILLAAQQGKPLRVVSDQFVTPTRTFDLARKVAELLEHTVYGTYHMTNTGECSWFEFAKEVLRLAMSNAEALPVTSKEFGAKAKRPAYSVLDNTRMRALGIAEFRPWQAALADFMQEEQRRLRSAA